MDAGEELLALLGEAAPRVPPSRYTATQPLPKPGRLYRFLRDKLKYPLHQQPHAELCAEIEAALGDCTFRGDEHTILMIGVPRGSWKTSIGAQGAPIYVLDENPNARILIDSRRHDTSKVRLRGIKKLIAANEEFADWKQPFGGDTWSDSQIVITARDADHAYLLDPSIATAGVDRSMTGAHFDFIIADDLVNDKNIQTTEARDAVYDHVLDLLPILEPGGVLVLLFTTWHTDDAYARIIKLDAERARQGLDPLFGRKIIRSAYNPDGSLYFPDVLTHDFLEKQRQKMGSRKFSAQYLLKPVADEDKTFAMDLARVTAFDFFTTAGRETGGLIRAGGETWDVDTTLAWDPAGRKATRISDKHGLTVVGCDERLTWWLCAAIGAKGTPTAIIERVIRLILRYRPWKISCEDTFGSGLWLDLLSAELVKRNISVALHSFATGGVSKAARIELLQPKWEGEGIILKRDVEAPSPLALVYPDVWRQFDAFTPGTELDHEDELDSLVQHLGIARPPMLGGSVLDANPKDPEWDRWRSLVEAEPASAARSRAGRSGRAWQA